MNDESSLSEIGRFDELCDAFEQACKQNESPRIEAYLERGKDLDLAKLFKTLLEIELEYRERRGEKTSVADYSGRFSEYQSTLAVIFGGRDGSELDMTMSTSGGSAAAPPDEASQQTIDTDAAGGTARALADESNQQTIDTDAAKQRRSRPAPSEPSPPQRYGRYQIEKTLGSGAFGQVMLARDEELERQVALKVPHRERIARKEDLEAYIAEARTVANLKHPNLVQVYNIERTDDGLCFVVSEYIKGRDLQQYLKERRLSHFESAQIVADIADALDYAHERKVFHRDVKPGNILISDSGTAHLADFGLAIKEEDWGRGAKLVGTPAYMSPEQARGEGHRVDGRSDIFSLGVVMYELLTGKIPWRSKKTRELLDEIAETEVPPLKQQSRDIHPELERICLKALALKLRDRYSLAGDFANEIRDCMEEFGDALGDDFGDSLDSSRRRSTLHGSQQASRSRRISASGRRSTSGSRSRARSGRGSVRAGSTRFESGRLSTVADESAMAPIVPKGLRFFDTEDKDFFLRLLPGPRDRYGLPESIRFWQNRIEADDPTAKCPVGLIYGPSGCGKSSFVRAGLIPELDVTVTPVVIQASATGMEQALVQAIREKCTGLEPDASLVEILRSVRRGKGLRPSHKLLIVIDQFEQWLNFNSQAKPGDLHMAMRQCDGERVQCLLLARTEYTIGIHRFMSQLDTSIEEGRNAMVVDLFDKIHAGNVLKEFGRSYGRIPKEEEQLKKEHGDFLHNAIDELAENEKVSPIRISVFADMMKGRDWTAKELWNIGGAHAVGQTFLEEAFEAETAPLAHRIHQQAAQSVLIQLLPEGDADIKGAKRTVQELQQASGYESDPAAFNELMSVLDGNLRLVTPTDAEADVPHYQLTHDFLVPSLRNWLSQKRQSTTSGRAQHNLETLASLWSKHKRAGQLPSLWEYLNIQIRTRSKAWTNTQRQMMRRATSYYALRTGMIVMATLVLSLVSWDLWRTTTLIAELVGQETAVDLQETVEKLEQSYVGNVGNRLQRELARENVSDQAKLNLQIALARRDAGDYVDDISELIFRNANPGDMPDLIGLLSLPTLKDPIVQKARDLLAATTKDQAQTRLRAACLLAGLDAEQWTNELAEEVTQTLISMRQDTAREWVDNGLETVKGKLFEPLKNSYLDPNINTSRRVKSCFLITLAAKDSPASIADLIPEVRSVSGDMRILLDGLRGYEKEAVDSWTKELTSFREEIKEIRSMLLDKKHPEMLALQQQLRATLEPDGDAGADEDVVAFAAEQKLPEWAQLKQQGKACRELDERIEELASKTVNLAVALLDFEESDRVWPLFAEEEPRVVSLLIHRIPELPVPVQQVLSELVKQVKDDPDRRAAAKRRGLLQCLSEYVGVPNGLAAPEKLHSLTERALELYPDSDPGVHSAAKLLLKRLQVTELPALPYRMGKDVVKQKLERPVWWQNPDELIMVAIPHNRAGFLMGSPYSEVGRDDGGQPLLDGIEGQHLRIIPRSYAISSTEITVKQYQFFIDNNGKEDSYFYDSDIAPNPDCPAHMINFAQAADYCNWLSWREKLPQSEWCYTVHGNGSVDQKPNHLNRLGYRLPTEAEWEYACRAGTSTSRYFGESILLIENYAWILNNGSGRSYPVGLLKPNRWGLFDMLGNIAEWCDDRRGGLQLLDESINTRIGSQTRRPLRGGAYTYGFYTQIRSAAADISLTNVRERPIGFRVAKTLFVHEPKE